MSGKKKVLVTGGCGYIGSHTLVDLVSHGYDAVSIDNCCNSYASAIEGVSKIAGHKVVNHLVDLCDLNATRKVFEQEKNIEAIIHFAALKSVPDTVKMPLAYFHNNLSSLLNLLQLAKEFGVKHFVFSSSCSVYGNPDELPVTEQTPVKEAESPYARTKQMGEDIIRDFATQSDMRFLLLRYFNPAGAHESNLIGENQSGGMSTALIPRICAFASGRINAFTVYGNDYDTRDGTCIRDYIHVMDIAHAHTLALQFCERGDGKTNCEVFNLGTGNGITVLEMIQSFERVAGIQLKYTLGERRAGDVVKIFADNTKATTKLGWQPQRSLDEMTRTAWQWEQYLVANTNP